jgi:hypothetical protein
MSRLKATIRLVCNLAAYPHSDAQRDKIVGEMKKLSTEVEAAFRPAARDDNFQF